MQTYKFDADTKEYLYAEEAFLDPLETEQQGKEVYLLPADSTFAEPLEAKESYAVVWNGDKWEYKEDHRQKRDMGGVPVEGSGTPYWLPGDTWQTPARYMKELGKLPEGAMPEKPEKPLETVRTEKLSELAAKFSAAEADAHLTSSLGIVINAGEKANRDIDGLVKLMEAVPDMETVDFCCYDNSFKSVTLADLKTMQIEVILSGNELYAQKWAFREAINAVTSKKELEAITIEFTFSDFSKEADAV